MVSPNLRRIHPDAGFPNMIAGDPADCTWPWLRRGPHIWYCDRRVPGIGFLSRDEAHIVYNAALCFAGRPALEIGCFLGWSTCHLVAGGVNRDVVDPVLADHGAIEAVTAGIAAAGGARYGANSTPPAARQQSRNSAGTGNAGR